MIKSSTLAVILAALIISVVFMNEADGAGLVWRAVNKSGSSIHDIANVTERGCGLNQYLSVNSSAKWACTTLAASSFTNLTPVTTSGNTLVVSNSSNSGVLKNIVAGTGMSITNNTQDLNISTTITQGFTNIYPISTSTNATLIVSNDTNTLITKNLGAGAGITLYNGTNTIQINMTTPINILSTNATISTDNGDALVFDIPLTANSGNGISGLLIANSFTTGSAVRAGMNVTNLNTRGTCLVSSTLTATTTSLDNLVMNTVLTGRSTNSSDIVWLLANNTNPITFDCALISGSPAGNLRVWITAEESPLAGRSVQALAGSYFFHTP